MIGPQDKCEGMERDEAGKGGISQVMKNLAQCAKAFRNFWQTTGSL